MKSMTGETCLRWSIKINKIAQQNVPFDSLFSVDFFFRCLSDMSCRSRLAVLNEKLTVLERRIDYLEACVTKGETLT